MKKKVMPSFLSLHKKGLSITIIVIILAIVVLIFYLYFGTKANDTIREASDRENCRDSVILHASTKSDKTWVDNPVELKCKTQYVDIREEGIFKNIEQAVEPTVTKETVQRAIANEMYDCWYQFLQGSVEVFDRSWAIEWDNNFRSQCIICSEISFKVDNVEGDNRIDDFFDWLSETKIGQYSTDTGGGTQTYYDYLGRTSPTVMSYEELVNSINIIECGGKLMDIVFPRGIVESFMCLFDANMIKAGASGRIDVAKAGVPQEYVVVFKALMPLRVNFPVMQYYAAVYLVNKEVMPKLQCEQLY